MRSRLFEILLIACATTAFGGSVTPLTVKDISLMLRSGYSADAVMTEMASRHIFGAPDAEEEKKLVRAGASPALITALKSGTYAVQATDIAAVRADLETKAQRRAAQVEESRKQDTVFQEQVLRARTAPFPVAGVATANSFAPLLKGDLVTSKNGILSPYLDETFEKKKLIGFFFSAHWCQPCRKFTPELVAFYNKNAAAHPELEIVFVSSDKTAAAMETDMRETQMPWPAISFDKVRSKEGIIKYAGSGIPCLVIVDASGKVVFDSYAGTTYRGPAAVLTDLDQLFAKN